MQKTLNISRLPIASILIYPRRIGWVEECLRTAFSAELREVFPVHHRNEVLFFSGIREKVAFGHIVVPAVKLQFPGFHAIFNPGVA
jgi:hypothetical protein